ncbi:MAG: helix-turn-helix transcriptional regulator [Wujia sp.]
MGKSENQKLKLLYLRDKFMQDTDEQHGITVNEIIDYLGRYDIRAERKSVYDDIETLRTYGMDILKEKRGGKVYYKLVSRQFELPELKLLVDSVQASKFITTRKTNELIKKLESLSSRYEAGELQRQVYVLNRVKNPNEKIYMSVDALHRAIHEDVQVEFQYTAWNLKKKLEPKHDGRMYHVSPWALIWDDENYYLVGYDEDADCIKHFRVDKLMGLQLTERKRHGKELFGRFDPASYAGRTFGMYGGEEQCVKLRMENRLVGVLIDRFGKDIIIIPDRDGAHFTASVNVAVSTQFLGWIVGLGPGVQILEPASVRTRMKDMLKNIESGYAD